VQTRTDGRTGDDDDHHHISTTISYLLTTFSFSPRYLHGVKEAEYALEQVKSEFGYDMDLIEMTSLKPFDMDTIKESLSRTHKIILLDESTLSGGVGATVSALVGEQCFDLLDAPVKRLCMDDAPVPYASSMEKAVVKRAEDLVEAMKDMVNKKI
jgi:pyruvate/2-oxoglutarate/acetoin dehydrogenase E1 component